ncbi:MAG TPA: ROK family protein [Terriglobales bacterium]
MVTIPKTEAEPMRDPKNILVFDVGGSHIAAGVFHTQDMALTAFKTSPVTNSASAEDILGTFETLLHGMGVSAGSFAGIGVAMPAPFDYQRGISYMEHKYRKLYGVSVRNELARRLGCAPERVHFLNDATAFLIGELSRGAAIGCDRAVGITLGTGVGSAFAVDGKIVTEGAGVPPGGEIWNFPYNGATVEDVVSTRAIQRFYQQRQGKREDVKEIARLAANYAPARGAFEQFGHELGKALRATCAGFKPDRVVLGGGIARSASLFLPAVASELTGLPFTVRVSDLDHRAPLIGAGMSWAQLHGADVAAATPETTALGAVEA